MASVLEARAKDAFIDDHFELAVDLYSQAISLSPENAVLYSDRAQANIKLNSFTAEAVEDANRAIELDPSMSKAYLRKGMACFSLEEFQSAKSTFETSASLAPEDTRFSNWIKKCDKCNAGDQDSDMDEGLLLSEDLRKLSEGLSEQLDELNDLSSFVESLRTKEN